MKSCQIKSIGELEDETSGRVQLLRAIPDETKPILGTCLWYGQKGIFAINQDGYYDVYSASPYLEDVMEMTPKFLFLVKQAKKLGEFKIT